MAAADQVPLEDSTAKSEDDFNKAGFCRSYRGLQSIVKRMKHLNEDPNVLYLPTIL